MRRDWHSPAAAGLRYLGIASVICIAAASPAHADVFGRLQLGVVDADTGKGLAGATVTLHDPTGVRPDIVLTADSEGNALSPQLEVHAWQIETATKDYDPDNRSVTVVPDTATEVDIVLQKTATVIKVTANRNLIRATQPTDTTTRNQNFLKKYPATAGNPQDLKSFLTTTPGFVSSSANVAHPRGEHASTTIYINGALVPGALQGRGAGALLSPQVIQNADVQTGGYAPEYGSETAAILNLSLKSGTIKPYADVTGQIGGFNTYYGEIAAGGQGGAPLDSGIAGPAPKKLRYFFDFSKRYTDNSMEPPQPGDQTAHNHSNSTTGFGNIEYSVSPKDQVSLVVNTSPARTEVANRTGLPDKYADVGQGYGYGGARNADGTIAGITADPTVVGSQTIKLGSQQSDGQDIYQTDGNSLGLLNLRHTFTPKLTGLFSVGVNHSQLDLRNNNPSIDLGSVDANGLLTTIDNSIEYNPNLTRKNDQTELAGSLSLAQGAHTYKAGFTLNLQHGDESYQFVPQSQLALDALFATDPRLAPAGSADPSGAVDVLGNPVYLINPGSATPTLNLKRNGYYNAAYVQDTWRASRKSTLNYGLRLDSYYQKLETQGYDTATGGETYLSPRLNYAYAFTPATVGRLSYNKLFTQPPLAEGAVVGTVLKPEILDQYDASVEHQIGSTQTVKLAYYYKNITNQNDTGILLPYTQIGAYTTLQYQRASVHGFELSYDLSPKNNVGLGGYLAYTNSLAKPGGLDQTGADAPDINDHDQRHTVSTGLSYTFKTGDLVGLDYYYGSGEASSVLASIADSNVLNDGKRNSNQHMNVRVASRPGWIGKTLGAEVDVENIFDSRDVLNFNSGFSGTRFQQGRRVLFSLNGRF